MARALDLHSRGRRFDSDILHRVLLNGTKARRQKAATFKENRNDDRLLIGKGPITGTGYRWFGPRMGHGFDPRDDCTAKAKARANDL